MAAFLDTLDRRFSSVIHKSEAGFAVETLVLIPAMLFGWHVVPVLVLLAFFVLPGRIYVALFIASVITLVVVDLAKVMFGRHRPRAFARRYYNVRSLVKNHAMPSGDSAQAAVWASMLFRTYGSPVAFFILPCTMLARVFFGAHWIGDTLVGAAVGLIIESMCSAMLQYFCSGPSDFLGSYVCGI